MNPDGVDDERELLGNVVAVAGNDPSHEVVVAA